MWDNLNNFYAGFDTTSNYSTFIEEFKTLCDNDNNFDISEHEAHLLFKEINCRKLLDNIYITVIVKNLAMRTVCCVPTSTI